MRPTSSFRYAGIATGAPPSVFPRRTPDLFFRLFPRFFQAHYSTTTSLKATLRALEDFKTCCKILTFLFHNSPQLLVAGYQLFCKSVWPPEKLNAYIFPLTKSFLNTRYQGQNNKIRQCSAELMGDASLIMLWMSTKIAQLALRNICTVSLRKTNTSIDFVDDFLLLRISSQHPSLRFFTPAYIAQSCFGVEEFSRL